MKGFLFGTVPLWIVGFSGVELLATPNRDNSGMVRSIEGKQDIRLLGMPMISDGSEGEQILLELHEEFSEKSISVGRGKKVVRRGDLSVERVVVEGTLRVYGKLSVEKELIISEGGAIKATELEAGEVTVLGGKIKAGTLKSAGKVSVVGGKICVSSSLHSGEGLYAAGGSEVEVKEHFSSAGDIISSGANLTLPKTKVSGKIMACGGRLASHEISAEEVEIGGGELKVEGTFSVGGLEVATEGKVRVRDGKILKRARIWGGGQLGIEKDLVLGADEKSAVAAEIVGENSELTVGSKLCLGGKACRLRLEDGLLKVSADILARDNVEDAELIVLGKSKATVGGNLRLRGKKRFVRGENAVVKVGGEIDAKEIVVWERKGKRREEGRRKAFDKNFSEESLSMQRQGLLSSQQEGR